MRRQATHNENDRTLKCGENHFTNNRRLTLDDSAVLDAQLTNQLAKIAVYITNSTLPPQEPCCYTM